MKTKTKKIKTKKSRKSKYIRNIIIWVAVLGVLGWFASLRIDTGRNSGRYDYVIPFEERNLSSFIPASGKIVLHDIEPVSTDVTQKLKSVYFKVGDNVSEGDVLCEFESEDLDEQISRLEKYLADSKAAEELNDNNSKSTAERMRQAADLKVQTAKINLDAARKSYDDTYARYSDYFDRCYTASNSEDSAMYYNMYKSYEGQLEPINDQIRAAQKEYDAARRAASELSEKLQDADYEKSLTNSDTSEIEKNLEKLKAERENLVVKAPRSGIIAESFASEGGYAVDGCLFRIGSLGKYKVEAYVNSRDILDVSAGMKASVKTILTGSEDIEAKVTKVSDIFSTANNGYAVEIEITDDSVMSDLRHNANTAVRIYDDYQGRKPAVQYDAIVENDDGTAYVYKAVKRGGEYVAEKVNIEPGYRGDFYVEVQSSDLKTGDYIVGNGADHSSGERLKLKGMAG